MKVTADVVAGLVGSVLAKRFDESTASPEFHHELWELACSPHQYVAVAAPRGHAKSTAGTISYGLAMVLFREAKHVLIVSDTEAQATAFVGAIKSELQENKDLIDIFGISVDEKGEAKFIKDAESEIIVEFTDGHKFRILAKGAEQKLRGLLWNGTRPDLVIIDDLENDELVMNKDRRMKLRRWFFSALMPAISRSGRIRMWGTILHMDSLLESLMPPYNDKMTVREGLKVVSRRRRMWKSVKYRAHNEDMTEFLWPQRFGKEFFLDKKEEARLQGLSDTYSQEYLNEPIDDSVAFFRRGDFIAMDVKDKDKNLRFYATADLAISEDTRADYTVFVVAGIDDQKHMHVRHVIRERMDAREIVDTILALQRAFDLQCMGIEEMQVSKAIGPFLNEEMVKQNTFVNLIPMKHSNKDKLHRANAIQARMRTRSVRFDKEADWYPTFEDELLKFPRGVKDDQVDAFAYLGLMLNNMVEAETKEELEEEEYLDELRASGHYERGRSSTTGY